MGQSYIPRRKGVYHLTDKCIDLCRFSPDREDALPDAVLEGVLAMCNDGQSNRAIHRWLGEQGVAVSLSSVNNHTQKHLIREGGRDDLGSVAAAAAGGSGRALSDLEILDSIIQKGASGLARSTARITPEMTLKAMELRLKLTQGSVFDGFMRAVSEAYGSGEAPEAQSDEGERAQAGAE